MTLIDGVYIDDGDGNAVLQPSLNVIDDPMLSEDPVVISTAQVVANTTQIIDNGLFVVDPNYFNNNIYYNENEQGFFIGEINPLIPAGSEAIGHTEYGNLMAQQGTGRIIVPDANGHPISQAQSVVPATAITHEITAASADVLGHVKIGEGVAVDSAGTISVDIPQQVIQYVSGVGHYYDGAAWHTMIEAGRIIQNASPIAPAGTLLCAGAYLEQAEYPELYAAIGTAYGSSGSRFRLPDLRGRVAIGANTYYALASTGGLATVTLTEAQIPAHDHTATLSAAVASHTHAAGTLATDTEAAHSHTYEQGLAISSTPSPETLNLNIGAYVLEGGTQTTRAAGAHSHNITGSTGSASPSVTGTVTVNAAGSSESHSNMQPYLAVNHYIYTGRVLVA